MAALSWLFWVAAVAGLVALAVQRWAVSRFLNTKRPARAGVRAPFSVLKPLCGLDDALEENLRSFTRLAYPSYEVLLGVKDVDDPAYPVARRLAAEHPGCFRVVLQQGTPGLNPKVNQLVTLARAARHEWLAVSDSNATWPPGALAEMADLFADERVGCITSPVTGSGHETLGALLDNLHLASAIGPGQIGAKVVARQDLVVGKSMALRRRALDAVGGFTAFADVLAEDYVIGQALRRQGYRIGLAQLPVTNVAIARPVRAFFARYLRWSVIHRTAVSAPTYWAQALLNPWPLAVVAATLTGSVGGAVAASAVFCAKCVLDASAARALGCRPLRPGLRLAWAVALKDALLFAAWCHGLVSRTVVWRGHPLRVGPGSRLSGRPGVTALSVAEANGVAR